MEHGPATYQDADIFLKLFDRFESEEMYAARDFIQHELNVTTIDAFNDRYPHGSKGNRHFFRLYRFFEVVGTLYKNQLIHPDIIFDAWYVNSFYSKMYPIFRSWRQHGDAHVGENFEYLAYAELEWIYHVKGPDVVPELPYWPRG